MKNIKLLLAIIFTHSLFAQIKQDEASKEATRVFKIFSDNFNEIYLHKNNKKAVAEFGKIFESGSVYVRDLTQLPNDDTMKVKALLGQIQKLDSTTRTTFKILKINSAKENYSRNHDEVALDFSLLNEKLKFTSDSSGPVVNVEATQTAIYTLFIRLDETFTGGYAGRIIAIEKQGVKPNYVSVNKDVTWWANLSSDWQKIFREKNQLPKYPSTKDLEGIALIFDLNLSKSTLTDFSPLLKIKELRKLNVSNTSFSDLSVLDSCKYLGELNISYTKVRDLSKLQNHKSMRKLYMNANEIVSLAGIENMKKLIELEASDNQINDLTPLAGLENLEKLNLSVNKIFKIDALKNLIKLTELRLGKNEIEKIDALSGISELIKLDLFNNKITSIEPLRKHIKIAFLYMDFNPIKDLSPLSGFGYLTEFSMQHTLVTDLSPISKSSTMSYLNIAGSEVASLAPIDKFNVIKEFKMYNTRITKGDAAKYAKNHPGCKITYY
ncbi:MAG: leucine-rich repeat domain-containing protein [Cytophagales bacterium]